jgi:Protein of unknown function (DUF3987)
VNTNISQASAFVKSEVDWPEILSGEECENQVFDDNGEYDGEPLDPCPECGGEAASLDDLRSFYNDPLLDLPAKACGCDQKTWDIADVWTDYFGEVLERDEKEKMSRRVAIEREGLSAFVFGNPTLTNVAHEIVRCCNVPEELAVCGIFGALSAGIGKGLEIEYKAGATTPLGFFHIGFMHSGEGKTEASKRSLKPLYDKQSALREEWKAGLASVKANIIANKARISKLTKQAERRGLDSQEAAELEKCIEAEEALQRELVPPSVYMGDFTLEAQRNVLEANHGQTTMLSDDAGRMFQNLLGLNNKMNMPEDLLLLQGYSRMDFQSDRASGKSVHIEDVWCSLFWLSQPDKIELLTKNPWIVEGGFLARCLLARFSGEASVQSDDDVPGALMKRYGEQWNEIYDAYRGHYAEYQIRRIIKVSAAARACLKRIEKQIVDSANAASQLLKAFAARRMENLWRIVGLLHVARHLGKAHEFPLSDETVSAGVDVLNYFRRQQERMLGGCAEEKRRKQFKKLIDAVLQSPDEKITMRELRRKGWEEKDALNLAKQIPNHLIVEKSSGGDKKGRPSTSIRISPNLPLCFRDPTLSEKFRAHRNRRA